MWPASATQAADWPRLAGARGSLRHALALKGAQESQLAEVSARWFPTYFRYNVAVAGSIVLHDRLAKRKLAARAKESKN